MSLNPIVVLSFKLFEFNILLS